MKEILLIIISLLLFSCKSREKAVQKTETQTETKSEATARIEEQTFEIVQNKELSKKKKKKIDKWYLVPFL